jgi:hypothetical protein
VFVVSQVDDEGYVQPDAFTDAVSNMYPEDSLKTVVKSVAPECIADANANAKGKYKAKRFSSEYSFRNYAVNYKVFLINMLHICQ